MKPTVYIETSVISYYCSRPSNNVVIAGHQQTTYDWWENYKDYYDCYISNYVVTEISRGDLYASVKRLESVQGLPLLPISNETDLLANLYFTELPIPEKSKVDAAHLAVAVHHNIDYIVSWNFKHIVNEHVRKLIEKINLENNLKTPRILSPEELMEKP
ncbi:MAG: type II toxin-antitoxin system VapC family toxin [Candidatus Kapaibacterium sp.]|nr:type II toxin-antitoxin system VapC family toxin [Bacteroidota bacterium]